MTEKTPPPEQPDPEQPDPEQLDPELLDLEQPAAEPPARAFMRELARFTPRVLVTKLIVAANVGLFVVMVVSGVDIFSPQAQELLPWGATFAPLTASGEWWRLFSAMFIHIGLLHLAMNMWVLWSAGPLVERLLGNTGFAITYLLSGLAGGVASLWWNPAVVSAGASGAVFGVFGALLAFLLVRREHIPLAVLQGLRSSTLVFVGYNLVFGMMHKGIDMAAHVGGLAGGFVCALPLAHRFTAQSWRLRWRRNLAVLLVGAALVAGAGYLLQNDAAVLQQELDRFAKVEERVIDRYNKALSRVKSGEIADPELEKVLRNEVLPDWRATRQRIARIKREKKLPKPYAERAGQLLEYMGLRERGWELLADALAHQDRAKADRATQLQDQAEQLLKQMAH